MSDRAEFISAVQEEWTLPVARWFHDTYESLAPRHGWDTQEASRKAWEDVPPENRTLMLATVQEIIGRLMLAGWVPPIPPWADGPAPDSRMFVESEQVVAGAISTLPPFDKYHPAWALPIARRALDALGQWEPNDSAPRIDGSMP